MHLSTSSTTPFLFLLAAIGMLFSHSYATTVLDTFLNDPKHHDLRESLAEILQNGKKGDQAVYKGEWTEVAFCAAHHVVEKDGTVHGAKKVEHQLKMLINKKTDPNTGRPSGHFKNFGDYRTEILVYVQKVEQVVKPFTSTEEVDLSKNAEVGLALLIVAATAVKEAEAFIHGEKIHVGQKLEALKLKPVTPEYKELQAVIETVKNEKNEAPVAHGEWTEISEAALFYIHVEGSTINLKHPTVNAGSRNYIRETPDGDIKEELEFRQEIANYLKKVEEAIQAHIKAKHQSKPEADQKKELAKGFLVLADIAQKRAEKYVEHAEAEVVKKLPNGQ